MPAIVTVSWEGFGLFWGIVAIAAGGFGLVCWITFLCGWLDTLGLMGTRYEFVSERKVEGVVWFTLGLAVLSTSLCIGLMMATPLFTLACVGLGTVGVGLILKLTVTWGNHQIVKKDKEAKRLASIRADLLNRKDRAIKALLEERDINPILSMISYFTTEHRWGASEAEEVALALGEIGSPLGIPLLTHLTHSSAYRVTVPSNYIGIGMDPTRPENIALIGALLKKELGLHARNPQAFNREAIARAQRSARCALYRIR